MYVWTLLRHKPDRYSLNVVLRVDYLSVRTAGGASDRHWLKVCPYKRTYLLTYLHPHRLHLCSVIFFWNCQYQWLSEKICLWNRPLGCLCVDWTLNVANSFTLSVSWFAFQYSSSRQRHRNLFSRPLNDALQQAPPAGILLSDAMMFKPSNQRRYIFNFFASNRQKFTYIRRFFRLTYEPMWFFVHWRITKSTVKVNRVILISKLDSNRSK